MKKAKIKERCRKCCVVIEGTHKEVSFGKEIKNTIDTLQKDGVMLGWSYDRHRKAVWCMDCGG